VRAEPRRTAAAVLLSGLAAGFLYAGIASARLYVELFARPAASASASIDEQVAALKLSSAEIRAAVRGAGWPEDADVSLTFDDRDDRIDLNRTQLHYALSYLLYPKRIRLTSGRTETRYCIAVGPHGEFRHASVERVSDMMALVTRK
jgi:hypothetical protein